MSNLKNKTAGVGVVERFIVYSVGPIQDRGITAWHV